MGRTEAKALTLLAALMCVGMLVASPWAGDVCLAPGAQWWRRVTYMFCHANVIHLGTNVWALLYIVFLFRVDMWMLLLGALSASLVPDALVGVPTVGLSGVVFFLLGGITHTVGNKARYLSGNLSVILFGVLLPNIAWGVHLWCFVCGTIYSLCVWKKK